MTGPKLGSDPVRLAPANLAAVFAPGSPDDAAVPPAPDRSAGLRGLGLARRTTPDSAAADDAGQPADDELPGYVPTQGLSADPEPRVGDSDGSAPVTVIVYVSVSVRERLRAFHRTAAATYTTIVLDAVEATLDELAALLAANKPTPRSGALFSRRPGQRVRHDEAQVQVSLRPSREDLAVLDRLVEECGAPSRSALVTTALDRYLPPAPPARR